MAGRLRSRLVVGSISTRSTLGGGDGLRRLLLMEAARVLGARLMPRVGGTLGTLLPKDVIIRGVSCQRLAGDPSLAPARYCHATVHWLRVSRLEERDLLLRRSIGRIHMILVLAVHCDLLLDHVDAGVCLLRAVRLLASHTVRLLLRFLLREPVVLLGLLVELLLYLKDFGKFELLPWPDIHYIIFTR